MLVDEIDKAGRDFPNDLLYEVDRMAFRVNELRTKIPAPEVVEAPAKPGAEQTAAQKVAEVPLPAMVTIHGGCFLMGSPDSEEGRSPNEGPQREVQIASFAIGKYEVTFDEWDACTRDGACRSIENFWEEGRRPLTTVSWDDAQGYLRWLSKKTGDAHRLPSEAEWEYRADN